MNTATTPLFRTETSGDAEEVHRLMELGFSAGHQQRNIWDLRQAERIPELSIVAEDQSQPGVLMGSIRFWPITIAGLPSVLLGPLAVDPDLRGFGIGMELVRKGLAQAELGIWHFCFVSGEPDYYPKLGFTKINQSQLDLPSPIEEERLHMIPVSGDSLDDLPDVAWVIRSDCS